MTEDQQVATVAKVKEELEEEALDQDTAEAADAEPTEDAEE